MASAPMCWACRIAFGSPPAAETCAPMMGLLISITLAFYHKQYLNRTAPKIQRPRAVKPGAWCCPTVEAGRLEVVDEGQNELPSSLRIAVREKATERLLSLLENVTVHEDSKTGMFEDAVGQR